MKYRHQYHAGNFADVHKHVLLLEVLAALARKDKGFLFVDTHAGRGDYDLHPGDAAHPAEWQAGVAKLLAATPRHAALTRYRELVAAGVHGGSLRYPGSPLLALRSHCAPWTARCSSKHNAKKPAACASCSRIGRARARRERRWIRRAARAAAAARTARLRAHRSAVRGARGSRARTRRGRRCAAALRERDAVLWLPVKLRGDFDGWLATLRARDASRPVLASLLWMHPCDSRAALNGSALVLVNPPYLVEDGMREWLPELREMIGGPQSGCEVLSAS